ncbi:MAG: hypothetical protein Q9220_004211 [cf. Caloplaca sp. 1 TL-2023]
MSTSANNPSLSRSDDTLEEQIVYYHSKPVAQKAHSNAARARKDDDHELQNEKLRQVGLAQGMVQFAKTFSDGQAVDSAEIEKSKIILRELEAGCLPETTAALSPPQSNPVSKIEYSSREVSPAPLLLEQIVRAHQIFLLHHAPSLTALLSRLQRARFAAILKRFWDDFVWNWDVLLHGNPAVDIFNGLKLAAGGELGIGVGEEEWGSGEREVLEGFVGRTDGLVDLIVSRFGESPAGKDATEDLSSARQDCDWHHGQIPGPSDGVIFSGIGAIARSSVKDISSWVETLFKYGHKAYGAKDNPVAVSRGHRDRPSLKPSQKASRQTSRTRNRRPLQAKKEDQETEQPGDFGIPAPIVRTPQTAYSQQQDVARTSNGRTETKEHEGLKAITNGESNFGADTLMKYMTLGIYGSKWATPFGGYSEQPSGDGSQEDKVQAKSTSSTPGDRQGNTTSQHNDHLGYFMIGLQGDLEEEHDDGEYMQDIDSATDREGNVDHNAASGRLMLRTLTVARVNTDVIIPSNGVFPDSDATPRPSYERLRVVVYVKRPFIFTFFFDLQTDSLAIPSFYRSLHHQLGPLQRPLLNSTSPSKVSERLSAASAPKSIVSTRSTQPICDLVYDPHNLTVHTTIPNIPEPGSDAQTAAGGDFAWTRVEALSVHSHMINTYISTRRHRLELERTCKTNRGWWVVWMRLPHVAATQQLNRVVYREAFLVRKASDYVAPGGKFSFGGSWGRSSGSSALESGKLVEGIGIDARQYIEGLVSLNR